MSDEEEKASEAKDAPAGKSNKGLVVVVLAAAVVLGGGAAAAGAIVAVRMAPAAAPAPEHSAAPKNLTTKEFAPIVVDVRSADGTTHHLKVNIAAEVPGDGEKKEKEEDKGT